MLRTLYVDETGTSGAPSIVFLHGIGASSWMWWQQIAALQDFHCLNVDLPGHGQSIAVEWVSLADTADQLAELIQTRASEGIAHVVGLSLGGHLVLNLLERHSAVLRRAIISGVTAAPMPNRNLLKPHLWLISNVMKRRWAAELQAKQLGLPPDKQAAFTENWLAMSMDTYRRIFEEVMTYGVPSLLQHVDVAMLVTAGGRESQSILQAVRVISMLMPRAQGCIAPGLGHGWNVQSPDLFNAMVRAWVRQAPLPVGLIPA